MYGLLLFNVSSILYTLNVTFELQAQILFWVMAQKSEGFYEQGVMMRKESR